MPVTCTDWTETNDLTAVQGEADCGRNYKIEVVAVDEFGNESPVATLTDETPPFFEGPLLLTPGDGEITAEWGPGVSDPDFSHYDWELTDDDGQVAFGDTAGTTVTIPGLENGTEYEFFVFARDCNGNGSESLSDTVTPDGEPSEGLTGSMELLGSWDGSDFSDWANATGGNADTDAGSFIQTNPSGGGWFSFYLNQKILANIPAFVFKFEVLAMADTNGNTYFRVAPNQIGSANQSEMPAVQIQNQGTWDAYLAWRADVNAVQIPNASDFDADWVQMEVHYHGGSFYTIIDGVKSPVQAPLNPPNPTETISFATYGTTDWRVRNIEIYGLVLA